MGADPSRGRRPKRASASIVVPQSSEFVAVLCCQALLRFVADCPLLARRVRLVLEAWGVPCVPLSLDVPNDVVAEVFGIAEQVHAVAAVATANVGLVWHPDQPRDRRPSTLHGIEIGPSQAQT